MVQQNKTNVKSILKISYKKQPNVKHVSTVAAEKCKLRTRAMHRADKYEILYPRDGNALYKRHNKVRTVFAQAAYCLRIKHRSKNLTQSLTKFCQVPMFIPRFCFMKLSKCWKKSGTSS